MRAAEYDRYGSADVVVIRDVPIPAPARAEILVRVHAAALNPKDVVIRSGRFRPLTGTRFPRRVGFDFAGEVARVGPGVSDLREGDLVWGMLDGFRGGTCAEYVICPASAAARMPASLSFEEAASFPLAGLTALQALRDVGRLREGGHVLVNGGSGGVGVHALQIARALGAHVTSVSSAANLALCRALGAETTLDYGSDALFAERECYDVVLDCFGNRGLAEVAPALRPNGTLVMMVPKAAHALDVARTLFGGERARFVVVRSRRADLDTLAHHVERGALRPVIDRVLPLDGVADGMRHLATKRARGKVVIAIDATLDPGAAEA